MNGWCSVTFLGLLTIFIIAAADDFQDYTYNQIIKNDLNEIESLLESELYNIHRRKRHEPTTDDKPCTKKKKWLMCCGEEEFSRIGASERQLRKECVKELLRKLNDTQYIVLYEPFNCERLQKLRKQNYCTVECVGIKKNLLDEFGNIKEEELLEYFKKELKSEEWLLEIVENVFPKCLQQMKIEAPFVRDTSDPLSCNPMAVEMRRCMWREIQLNCPDDKITDAKFCDIVRDTIKNNNTLIMKLNE